MIMALIYTLLAITAFMSGAYFLGKLIENFFKWLYNKLF